MAVPLFGFVEGDTVGLLILAGEDERLAALAARLEQAAAIRVAPKRRPRIVYRGQVLDPALTVAEADLAALDRFDVREEAA